MLVCTCHVLMCMHFLPRWKWSIKHFYASSLSRSCTLFVLVKHYFRGVQVRTCAVWSLTRFSTDVAAPRPRKIWFPDHIRSNPSSTKPHSKPVHRSSCVARRVSSGAGSFEPAGLVRHSPGKIGCSSLPHLMKERYQLDYRFIESRDDITMTSCAGAIDAEDRNRLFDLHYAFMIISCSPMVKKRHSLSSFSFVRF